MELFNKLRDALEAAEGDAKKFYDKRNSAAGTRLRRAMMEVKKIAQEIREDVSAKKQG